MSMHHECRSPYCECPTDQCARGRKDMRGAPIAAALAELSATAGVKVDQIMEQAQVFASAWSLIGGPFDSGDCLDTAMDEKARLREMVREALTGPQSTPLRWPHDDMGTATSPADDDTGNGIPFHVV